MRVVQPVPLLSMTAAIMVSLGAVLLSACNAALPGGSQPAETPTQAPSPTTHIAVADDADNRILIFNYPLTEGENPSIVIGQSSFTQGAPDQGSVTPSAATLVQPAGLAMDSVGNLWVADTNNCRVLEFQPPFTTGMSASLVIGEPDFETPQASGAYLCFAQPSVPPSILETPTSIAFDSHGDLWVADHTADRITEYVPPFSNGMAASVAIGQTNLASAGPCNGFEFFGDGPVPPPTAATLCDPSAVTFDSQGDLWVTDESNLRILEFVPPFSTGMSASLELVGQPPSAFSDDSATCVDTSASSFCYLDAIAFDSSDNLWVADGNYRRVLEFVPPFSNGMAASVMLGQPNFNETGPSDSNVTGSPGGLSFDSSGNLIISGSFFASGRLVVYAPPFSSGAAPATIMGGQQCPSSSSFIISANTLCGPGEVVAF